MKRFEFDDEDNDFDDLFPDADDEEDEDDGIDPEEYAELLERRDQLDEKQLNLLEIDLNQQLLQTVINMLSKSWFWKFKSYEKKIEIISDTYTIMKEIVKRV